MTGDAATQGLQVYIVGGAVRDALLGLTPGDHDWVVVGATPEDMARRGFIPVGWTKKQFPCRANSGYDRRTAPNEFGIYRLDLAEISAVCRATKPRPMPNIIDS